MNAQKRKGSREEQGPKESGGISAPPKVAERIKRVMDPEMQLKLDLAFWETLKEAVKEKGARGKELAAVARLIRAGADVNVRNEYAKGLSVFVKVSKEDEKDAASKFLPCSLRRLVSADGTELGIFSEFFFPQYSGTALMWAASAGHAGAVGLLIRSGAELNATDEDGKTALMEAVTARSKEVVKLLLDAGAKVDMKAHAFGVTALRLAELGAEPNSNDALGQLELWDKDGAINKDGLTEKGREELRERVRVCAEIAELLRAYGAKE